MSNQTLFGQKVKNPALARAISIESPYAYRQSIKRVEQLRNVKPLEAFRALVLAKNRAAAIAQKKNLSIAERAQFQKIAKIKLRYRRGG